MVKTFENYTYQKRRISINKILKVINIILLILIGFTMIYPFWEILVKSFMTDKDIISSTFYFWPKNWQFEGYKTTLAAYALSKKTLPGRKFLNFFFIFTMYFGGGLIPYYLLIKELNLMNTLWVLIIPSFISVYNVLIMRSFFSTFPKELIEAAKIDGASETHVFIKVVLPLSKAILATIALFIAVGVWNNWFTSMLFQTESIDFRPMAYTLKVIIDTSRGINAEAGVGGFNEVIGESVQYAAIIVSTVPILCVYPFLQKHFTKGVMIGSIKG